MADPEVVKGRECHKDNPRIPWLCSCNDCSRQAAARWHGLMDRVFDGDISLAEAQAVEEAP